MPPGAVAQISGQMYRVMESRWVMLKTSVTPLVWRYRSVRSQPTLCTTEHRANRHEHQIDKQRLKTVLSTRVIQRTKLLFERRNRSFRPENHQLIFRIILDSKLPKFS